jgi:ketosteroid isomerase-like protein
MTNKGKFAGGNDYVNEYCFIFEVEAGKIRRVREYVDTKRVTDLRAKAGLDV